MDAPPKNRTVKPNGDAISRLRKAKGWRVEDLAKNAKCSVRTVENVERGANVYLFTLAKFATALGVEYTVLVSGGDSPPEPPKKERRFKVQITLDVPYEEFDESVQLVSFMTMFKQLVQAQDEIMVAGVEDGSTIITLEMSIDEIQRLIDELTVGSTEVELDVFRVARVKLPDSEDFTLTQTVGSFGEGRMFEQSLRGYVFQRQLPRPASDDPLAVVYLPRSHRHDDIKERPVEKPKPLPAPEPQDTESEM